MGVSGKLPKITENYVGLPEITANYGNSPTQKIPKHHQNSPKNVKIAAKVYFARRGHMQNRRQGAQ